MLKLLLVLGLGIPVTGCGLVNYDLISSDAATNDAGSDTPTADSSADATTDSTVDVPDVSAPRTCLGGLDCGECVLPECTGTCTAACQAICAPGNRCGIGTRAEAMSPTCPGPSQCGFGDGANIRVCQALADECTIFSANLDAEMACTMGRCTATCENGCTLDCFTGNCSIRCEAGDCVIRGCATPIIDCGDSVMACGACPSAM